MILPLLFLVASQHLSEIPPERILMVVLAPAGRASDISSAEILETADQIFRRTAHVKVASTEQIGVAPGEFDACALEVRSTCWTKTVEQNSRERPRILMIVSLQPDPAGQAILLAAFDLNEATASLRSSESAENVERAIWEKAKRPPRELITRATLPAYFERVVSAELGALFERVAPKSRLGTLQIDQLLEGSELELDGKLIGVATTPSIIIDDVFAGSRRVRAKRPSGESSELIATVNGGATTRVDFSISERSFFTPAVKIGAGAIGAVAGATLLGAGLFTGGAPAVCIFQNSNADCDRRVPSLEAGPGGVAVARGDRGAPLSIVAGAGLLAAGATWSLGSWLFEEESPWWIALAGVLAGAAASGASAVLAR